MGSVILLLLVSVLAAGVVGVAIVSDDLSRHLRTLTETGGAEMAICRYCTAPIRFVRTRKGEMLPVDPHPDSTGTVAAIELLPGRYGQAYIVTSMTPALPGYRTFVTHFATCDRRPPDPEPDPAPTPGPEQDPLI